MNTLEIGNKIKSLRVAKGMNRNQLANKAGVSPTYIYQLENGKKSPTIEYLGYICWGLDISIQDFFNTNNNFINSDKVSTLSTKQRQLLNAFLESL